MPKRDSSIILLATERWQTAKSASPDSTASSTALFVGYSIHSQFRLKILVTIEFLTIETRFPESSPTLLIFSVPKMPSESEEIGIVMSTFSMSEKISSPEIASTSPD